MTGLDNALSPEILTVDGFSEMFEALKRSDVNAVISKASPLKHQDKIEAFNRDGRDVYLVLTAPLSSIREKLDGHLKKKGLSDQAARTELIEHAYEMVSGFLKHRQPPDDKWDVTVTSTFLHNTRQRQWHIDSYDATGKAVQMTKTLAGSPGTVISHSRDYDRKSFERLRDDRRAKEISVRKELAQISETVRNPIKRKLREKFIDTQVKRARKQMVLDMEALLKEMKGHQSQSQDIVLIRSGDVPHTSPVLDRRRLVITVVEFDEFM